MGDQVGNLWMDASQFGFSANIEAPQNVSNGAIPMLLHHKMLSSESDVKIFDLAPFKFRVLDMYLVMYGAGAAGDTVDVQDASANSIIGGSIDVAAAGDTDVLRAVEIDDAFYEIAKDGDLRVVTASGALAEVYIWIVPVK